MATRSRSSTKNPSNPKTPADATSEGITKTRTAKCRTLGNGSQLTYEVGKDAEDRPHIRLTAAAGGGFFSKEWIALPSIIEALDAWPAEPPLTSNALAPLFRGKSANNPSFLAAVLVAEGVLRRVEERKRHLERCEPTGSTGSFGGFVATRPAQKRQRKARTKKKAASTTAETDITSPPPKTARSHTAKTDETPRRKSKRPRSS